MMKGPVYYLAIDFGASSGRHILGHREADGRLVLEEVYRFENGVQERNGHLCWDYDRLFSEVLNGLRRCREIGKIPTFMGIDTWGVDFVLLDPVGQVLGDTVAYRDARTEGMQALAWQKVGEQELYERTGIAMQPFNTLYQLLALRESDPALLEAADRLLMVPSYFNYRLTGVMENEYTMASTSQMVRADTMRWDYELLGRLRLPAQMLGELQMPGSVLGSFSREVEDAVGFSCHVVRVAAHDTASAVVAVPSTAPHFAYISSGTWSLFGTELGDANTSKEARLAGFSNEGGYEGRFRFLKNIMGLWMIQSARREWMAEGQTYSFAALCDLAREADDFPSRVPVADARFLAPASMIAEIRQACAEAGMPVPQTVGEVAAVIYHSLAEGYATALEEMERLTGHHFDEICIVGGGSQAGYLNELTAKATGRTILAGPAEATAIGNLAVQMITTGELEDLQDARRTVAASFAVQRYV